MFTIITPDLRSQHKDLLSRIFQARKKHCDDFLLKDIELYDTPSTIYIAYDDPEKGVFGSCRLNPLHSSPASLFYRKHFQSKIFDSMREVSLVTFEREEGHSSHEAERNFAASLLYFYTGLYEMLMSLSMDHGYWGYMTLNADHNKMVASGEWSFDAIHNTTLKKRSINIGEIILGYSARSYFDCDDLTEEEIAQDLKRSSKWIDSPIFISQEEHLQQYKPF